MHELLEVAWVIFDSELNVIWSGANEVQPLPQRWPEEVPVGWITASIKTGVENV